MTARDDAIAKAVDILIAEGGVPGSSLHSWRCEDTERYPEPCTCVYDTVADMVDAVEPIIRADERERALTHSTGTDTGGPCCECCYEVGGRNFHLRAQVNGLVWGFSDEDQVVTVALSDVLRLLGVGDTPTRDQ